jgi:hypothetical protein
MVCRRWAGGIVGGVGGGRGRTSSVVVGCADGGVGCPRIVVVDAHRVHRVLQSVPSPSSPVLKRRIRIIIIIFHRRQRLLLPQLILDLLPRALLGHIPIPRCKEPPDEIMLEHIPSLPPMQRHQLPHIHIQILRALTANRIVDKVERSRHEGKDARFGVGRRVGRVDSSAGFETEGVEEVDLEVVEVVVEAEDDEPEGGLGGVVGEEVCVNAEEELVGFGVEGDDRGGGDVPGGRRAGAAEAEEATEEEVEGLTRWLGRLSF